jgi:nucleotide-binding universal stress UspA family protein
MSALAGTVVVGVDSTWHSRPALERAAEEARVRGVPLTLLSVVPREDDAIDEPTFGAVAAAVDLEADRVRAAHPALAVRVSVLREDDEPSADRLLGAARLLVVGHRSARATAFLLGTASRRLLRAARCPVLVVPDQWVETVPPDPDAHVVVGVGADPWSSYALRLATAEAQQLGARLVVVHSTSGAAAREATADRVTAGGELVAALLAETMPPASLEVESVITCDAPAVALIARARSARLLVVGSRGPIALARLASGSVSRAVLDDARVPVLVAVALPAADRHRPTASAGR